MPNCQPPAALVSALMGMKLTTVSCELETPPKRYVKGGYRRRRRRSKERGEHRGRVWGR